MKNRNLLISLAVLGSLTVAGTAQATGKIYIGAKAAVVDADAKGADSFDPGFALGVYGGFNLLGKDSQFAANLNGGTLAVEGEALLTVVKGDAKGPGVSGDWDISSIAAYAAYRHPLTDYFYLKGKAGLVHYKLDPSFASPSKYSDTDTLALGIGAGWKVGPGSIETEITAYGSDVRMLSAGFHMNF